MVGPYPREHLFDREGLVVGDAEVLDLSGPDHLLDAKCEVAKVPNGDAVALGDIAAHVLGEKVVDLLLGLVLRRELLDWDANSPVVCLPCVARHL